MSKAKELEALLITAAHGLSLVRKELRKYDSRASLEEFHDEVETLFTNKSIKGVLKWLREHNKAMRELDTVDAKVVTSKVAKDKSKKDKKAATKPSKDDPYTGSFLFFDDVNFEEIVKATKKFVTTEEGSKFALDQLKPRKGDRANWAVKRQTKVAKESKAQRTERNEKVHKVIEAVAGTHKLPGKHDLIGTSVKKGKKVSPVEAVFNKDGARHVRLENGTELPVAGLTRANKNQTLWVYK